MYSKIEMKFIDLNKEALDEYKETGIFNRVKFMEVKRLVELYIKYKEDIQQKEYINDIRKINKSQPDKTNDTVFITINPKPKVTFEQFKKVVDKIISKKYLLNNETLHYSYEQRGESDDEIGKGFHCHILFKRGPKIPHEIRREFKSSCKNICNISQSSCLNFKFTNSEYYDDKFLYLQGNKDEEKNIKCKFDIKFRKKYNLKNYY